MSLKEWIDFDDPMWKFIWLFADVILFGYSIYYGLFEHDYAHACWCLLLSQLNRNKK